MEKGKNTPTKFIATVPEAQMDKINLIARQLKKDGAHIKNVSAVFGIITASAPASLEALKLKYAPLGLTIEPDREVNI